MKQRGRPANDSPRRRNRELTGDRYKLNTWHPSFKGFVTRWVEDADGGVRLGQFEQMGYAFVTKKEIASSSGEVPVGDPTTTPEVQPGDKVSRQTSVVNGKPVYSYLMKIRKDWYDQDQADKQAEVDAIDAQLKAGHDYVENKHRVEVNIR